MNDPDNIRCNMILWSVIIISLLFLVTGCAKTVYVPVDSVRTEYRDRVVNKDRFIHDSIYIREKADTIFIEKYRTIYQDRITVDSILLQDTIRIPYPVDKIVYQNKTAWYQNLLIYTGLGAIGLLMLWLIKRKM